MSGQLTQVRFYHQQTKHFPERYARSLGYMEWSSQPCPFRRYPGSDQLLLCHDIQADGPLYDELFQSQLQRQSLDQRQIAALLRDSLALSAWKQLPGGPAWTLRVNPSSGNLHPSEAYLLLPSDCVGKQDAAVYHYATYEHALEYRRGISETLWQQLTSGLPADSFLIGLTSIFWRESWKYGERAYRYCQHDIGHALAALAFAAATQGRQIHLLADVDRAALSSLIAIDGQTGPEAEHADCLLAVTPADAVVTKPAVTLDRACVNGAAVFGETNRLSPYHHDWPIIDAVANSSTRCGPHSDAYCPISPRPHQQPRRTCGARQIIHQRRSAVAFDPTDRLSKQAFFHMLRRLMPEQIPFLGSLLPWDPCVAMVLFVHRVADLDPGAYLLPRTSTQRDAWDTLLGNDGIWLNEDPSIRLLQNDDLRDTTRTLSCNQDIAADGAFSLAMFVDFDRMLAEQGAEGYAQMYWECGALGQLLYLEAEAAGVRGTGIGCFCDDETAKYLGLQDDSWQDLYHFTVGTPVEDCRLRTADPYLHLQRDC